MKKLENKVALITGGAGSIGQETASLFLEHGARVMLVDLKEEALQEAAEAIGGGEALAYCAADVTDAEATQRYVQQTLERFGKLDIFFANAGIEGVVKKLEEYPEELFDKVMAVNVKGVWLGCKYGLPHLSDGGSFIITSSVAGLAGTANVSAYVTSKHAVVGLMKVAALEAAPRQIRVNSIHPSPVDNRMMRSLEEGFAPGQGAEAMKQFAAAIPLQRYADAIDIAQAALFLASDDSRFITAVQLPVDGGMGAAR
jgi:NAD(P)-dependent dehydrogenase (short-subunit alcohol dehydrogenase family)